MNLENLPEHFLIGVLNNLDIKDLVNACNSYPNVNRVCNENIRINNRVRGYLLLRRDISKMEQKFKDNALRKYASEGGIDAVKLLLDEGADIHAYNEVALNAAIKANNLDMVKLLVDEGADVNIDVGGRTNFLASAVSINNPDIIEYLVDNGAIVTHKAIREAVRMNSIEGAIDNFEIIEYLVDNSLNKQDAYDQILSLASYYANFDLMEYAIDNGALLNPVNNYPLKQAGNVDVIKFLEDNGANIHFNNDELLTEVLPYDIVEYLLDQGFDPNMNNGAAMLVAVDHHKLDVLQLLINRGGNYRPIYDNLFNIAYGHDYQDIEGYLSALPE